MKTTRRYEMRARAEATAATRAGLVRAAIEAVMAERTFGVTLAAIAGRAGVSVQTALRHFASRDALIQASAEVARAEVVAERTPPPEDRDGALAVLLDHYEHRGDFVLGMLAEEDREPMARQIADLGRREHRRWVEQVFADSVTGSDQVELVDLLVVATDVYAWKLLRRDRGLALDEVHRRLMRMTRALAPGREDPR